MGFVVWRDLIWSKLRHRLVRKENVGLTGHQKIRADILASLPFPEVVHADARSSSVSMRRSSV